MHFLQLVIALFLSLRSPAADEGKPAPPLEMKLLDGSSFSLANAKGDVLVIHLWASWCAACRIEMPALNAYYLRHRKEGLRVIALSMDRPEDGAKALEVMTSYHFDGGMAREAHLKAYGRIWRLPLTFVIDRQGVLKKDGWVTDHALTPEDLENTLTPLLKSRKP